MGFRPDHRRAHLRRVRMVPFRAAVLATKPAIGALDDADLRSYYVAAIAERERQTAALMAELQHAGWFGWLAYLAEADDIARAIADDREALALIDETVAALNDVRVATPDVVDAMGLALTRDAVRDADDSADVTFSDSDTPRPERITAYRALAPPGEQVRATPLAAHAPPRSPWTPVLGGYTC